MKTDTRERFGKLHPTLVETIWSLFTFRFVESILRKGGRGETVTLDDTFRVPAADEGDVLCQRLERTWADEVKRHDRGQKVSLVRALIRADGAIFWGSGILLLLDEASRLMQPILFGWLLRYFTDSSSISPGEAWLYGAGMSLATLLDVAIMPQFHQRTNRTICRWRTTGRMLCYKKILKMSQNKIAELTTGHIIELTSSDIAEIHQFAWQGHYLWVGPLKAVCGFWFLYSTVGPALLVGYGAILVLMPMQYLLSKVSAKWRKKKSKAKDERVQLISEIINGMRIIKMYCWEKPFSELLKGLRRNELDHGWYMSMFSYVLHEIQNINTRLIGVVVVLAAMFMNKDMTFSQILPLLSMLEATNSALFFLVTWGMKDLVHATAAMARVETFLLMNEKEHSMRPFLTPADSSTSVALSGVSAYWSKEKHSLHDLNISVQQGQLAVVIGQVGCGKSSLLQLLSREMPTSSGTISVQGSVIYARQQPWVFPGTIKDNILFGNAYDPVRFREVLDVTALNQDLSTLPQAEMTRVGDRGVTLSGGQKARLGLARAIYQRADVYLLDDPLSAVDTAVARHIFQRCIMGYLRSCTRILVTHQLQFVREADIVIVIDKGRILSHGSFSSLPSGSIDFQAIFPDGHTEKGKPPADADTHTQEVDDSNSQKDETREEYEEDTPIPAWDVMKGYFSFNRSYHEFVGVFLLNLLARFLHYLSDWWLAAGRSDENRQPVSSTTYVTVVCAMTVALFAIGMIRGILFSRYTRAIATRSHEALFESVIRSPIRLFDVNPSGRILNRFSSDMNFMDNRLSFFLYEFMQNFTILAVTVAMTIYVTPWLILPCSGLVYYTLRVRRMYMHGRKYTIPMESSAISPILSYVKVTLEGLDTIRSMDKVQYCTDVYQGLNAVSDGLNYTNVALYNWFNLRMMATVGAFVSCTVFLYIWSTDYANPTMLGLSLSYTIPLMESLISVVRISVHVILLLHHVERVLRFCALKSEAALDNPKAPKNWPYQGSISIRNLNFRYSEQGPTVLTNVSLSIRAKEKVGIVGRTGAGKSSLVQALFRMAESEGDISIDGVETRSLGLHAVRDCITIIPQDPVLFSGPVRRNLDPFNEHSDENIWRALKQVQLEEVVRGLNGALDSRVIEGGANFSVGQRQLLCLARATLKQNRIIVLDEATANVDKQTDEVIQKAIRDTFRDSTILTVAHRLNTVMDSDRIIVLQSGRVVEFDSPYKLLQDRAGAFSGLVAETGGCEESRLRQMAERAHECRLAASSEPAHFPIANGYL